MTIAGVATIPEMLGKADILFINAATVCQDIALAHVSPRLMADDLRMTRNEHAARERCLATYRAQMLTQIAYVPPAHAEAVDTQGSTTASTIQTGDAPSTILEQIKQAAASRYPDDYSMQKFRIEKEHQAYEELQRYSAAGVPDNILNHIKNQAAERYPKDYSMRKFRIEKEVSSYQDLHR
jgi:hypothetical protein